MSIGELHATYVFETPEAAKSAWEKVAERCRNVSVNRWAVNPPALDKQAITILTEEPDRAAFERACALLSRKGQPMTPPLHVIETLREKRSLHAGGRRVVRAPGGNVIIPGGIDLGPLRRPQG